MTPSRRAAGDDPVLIGLTGPIGCGKSTIGRWIAGDGGVVIDADAVAREVTAPGQPGHDAVIAWFGAAFRRPDGSLDRAALGRHVFADANALVDLERIVHPLVRPRILSAVAAAREAGAPAIAIEAIKLVEAGYGGICDEVWLVTCSEDDQQRRLIDRGMSREDARQRARAQVGMTERLTPAATRVIRTTGSVEETRERVEAALREARTTRFTGISNARGEDAARD